MLDHRSLKDLKNGFGGKLGDVAFQCPCRYHGREWLKMANIATVPTK